MRIHHLQHIPFETLGSIQDWIDEHKFPQSSTHLYNNEKLPSIDTFDVLIILGGPMSVHDESEINWLRAEKEFIKKTIVAGKPIIGICLGAQLIADVLDAKVYKNSEKEIGWFPLQAVMLNEVKHLEKNHQLLKLLDNATVFHWHGETFDLPENAICLASSKACKNQAFLYNQNILGLQFHLEMNENSINNIIENCKDELVETTFIQSEKVIKENMKKYIYENRKLLYELLNYFQ